ncbi:hypothetical protein [Rhizobium ruizarguesonis]|uniref:hypothetical protein n=1 Tax=Rhizobium ruizarguesonis TaxID=2081791 RepID=UPI001030BD31|nr:hypothetical protein [Rhizobium ruizarguesonis]TAW02084.1 hypothetical protein ELI25_37620 [Rhizobium ruizarguesonis]TAZ47021.1 hypothetical protein ELH76_32480 [Rhizobium ruizarguesonis]
MRAPQSIFVALVVLFSTASIVRSSENLESQALLTYTLTMHNPKSVAVAMVRVGLVNSPDFTSRNICKSMDRLTIPLADYVVPFSVTDEGTEEIPASPPLIFGPHETRTFTISVLPNTAGACGFWASNIKVFGVFNNNEVFYSSVQKLTASDVAKYSSNTPDDKLILAYLKSPNPEMRIQGLEHLTSSDIDGASKTKLIRHKLEDADIEVVDKAIQIGGQLRIAALAPDIEAKIRPFLRDLANIDMKVLDRFRTHIEALTQIQAPTSADILLAALAYCSVPRVGDYLCTEVIDALVNLGQPSIINRVRNDLIEFATSNKLTFTQDQDSAFVNIAFPKYGNALALIALKDTASIDIISTLLSDNRYQETQTILLMKLAQYVSDDTVDDSEFLKAMRPIYKRILTEEGFDHSPLAEARLLAFRLALFSGGSREEAHQIVDYALSAPDLKLRMEAISAVKTFGFTDEILRIRTLLDNWPHESDMYNTGYFSACRVVNDLGSSYSCE